MFTILFSASFFFLLLSIHLLSSLPDEDIKCRKRLYISLFCQLLVSTVSKFFVFVFSPLCHPHQQSFFCFSCKLGLLSVPRREETLTSRMSDMAASVQKQTNRAEDDIRIMCVGLTIVDMITVIEKYPEEDSDQRSVQAR